MLESISWLMDNYFTTMKHGHLSEVDISILYTDTPQTLLDTSTLLFSFFFISHTSEYSRDTSWYVMMDVSILIEIKLQS